MKKHYSKKRVVILFFNCYNIKQCVVINMYKNIDDFSLGMRKKIAGEFFGGSSVQKIMIKHGLTRNEVLAILNDRKVDAKRLRYELSTFDMKGDKFIAIADTHIGSIYEDMDLLNYIYDYACSINVTDIVHGGDVIQSTMRPTNPKLRNEYQQLVYTVDHYPERKGIRTHICLGNHDFHTLAKDDEYIKVLESRKDFDIIGFKRAYFTWNKYLLNVKHEINKYGLDIPNYDTQAMICGHRHEPYVHGHDKIMLPCACRDVKNYHEKLSLPGFFEIQKVKDNMVIISHEFLPVNYDEKEFEEIPRKVTRIYKRKLNKNFKLR
jgi:predicted phosphodiesterase